MFSRPRLDEGEWAFFERYNSLDAASFGIPLWQLNQFYGGDGSGDVPMLGFFTLGDLSDGDGDGLTDAFERLVFGSYADLPDSDFDGVDDYYEYLHGSPYDDPDADDDGLSDLVEKGGIVVGNQLPWLSAEGAADITALFPDADCSFVDYPLPAGTSVNVNGRIYDSLRIDVNGAVHLNCAGETDEQWAEDVPTDFGRSAEYESAPVLAPFWTDFELAADSSVKVFAATYAGRAYHVVEFSNMKLRPSWEPDLETASFQLAIPQGVATEVYVRFGNVVGANLDGRLSGVGFKRANARYGHAYCYCDPGRICSGLGLTFVFGLGSSIWRWGYLRSRPRSVA